MTIHIHRTYDARSQSSAGPVGMKRPMSVFKRAGLITEAGVAAYMFRAITKPQVAKISDVSMKALSVSNVPHAHELASWLIENVKRATQALHATAIVPPIDVLKVSRLVRGKKVTCKPC